MSELTFCRQFLTALDSRPSKLSSDHIADARKYPDGAVFVLPKLPSPPHPARPKAKDVPAASSASAGTSSPSNSNMTITLKPLKPAHPTVSHATASPSTTSIYDLKTAYATQTQVPEAKIKLLYKKKPVADSKTVAEVLGVDAAGAAGDVEFGVMILGGAVPTSAGSSPAATSPAAENPPASVPVKEDAPAAKAPASTGGPAAQGKSGKEVVKEEAFWEDLRGFVVQRTRDVEEGDRLVGLFRKAWEDREAEMEVD